MAFFECLIPKKKAIVIIEDDASILEAVVHLLGNAGYRIYKAANGKEGLAQAYQYQPDLVILDIGLPDIDGWQVIKNLRSASKTKDIPILVLTVLTQMSDISRVLQMANAYLPKPLNAGALFQKVKELLAKKS